ncbi:hypothetical protein M231_07126 [Tremella mesenterica]|uniref:Uncharacterized protein n=1 Tax=Tremella mesenterica TaxID=5217 RepID=A0A4Q1BCT9_TREME|nr:hypothetical protein M231_07126 [Tremella mesenterica]
MSEWAETSAQIAEEVSGICERLGFREWSSIQPQDREATLARVQAILGSVSGASEMSTGGRVIATTLQAWFLSREDDERASGETFSQALTNEILKKFPADISHTEFLTGLQEVHSRIKENLESGKDYASAMSNIRKDRLQELEYFSRHVLPTLILSIIAALVYANTTTSTQSNEQH